MARRRKGRPIDGVILVDKPTGISSNHVLQKVRGMFAAQKAGHTGALDPLATGMLPVCLGEATKFSQYLLDSDKRYQVVAHLGVRTDTSDADGEVVAEKPVQVTVEQVESALEQFRGPIKQVPTMFSALKYQGKPLYEYARKGIEVPREARPITVYAFDIVKLEGDRLTMDVHCSKGTYVRTLVDDLGEVLGCGAHVAALRRTQVADYPVDQMFSLEQLQALRDKANEEESCPGTYLDELLLPADTAVSNLPELLIDDSSAPFIRNGNPVRVSSQASPGAVRIKLESSGEFIGVGELDEEKMLAPKRLIVPAEYRQG